jgi:hypothetical protein
VHLLAVVGKLYKQTNFTDLLGCLDVAKGLAAIVRVFDGISSNGLASSHDSEARLQDALLHPDGQEGQLRELHAWSTVPVNEFDRLRACRMVPANYLYMELADSMRKHVGSIPETSWQIVTAKGCFGGKAFTPKIDTAATCYFGGPIATHMGERS